MPNPSSARAKKILGDLVDAAIGARTHFDMWWAQVHTAKLEPKYFQAMNAHSDFFLASQNAHYKAMFVDFALLFDGTKSTSSISAYLRVIQESMGASKFKQLKADFDALKRRAKPLIEVRHSTVAHINVNLTEKEFFAALDMTWDEIRGVINDAVAFIACLADSSPGQLSIPSEGRMERATIRLLKSVKL